MSLSIKMKVILVNIDTLENEVQSNATLEWENSLYQNAFLIIVLIDYLIFFFYFSNSFNFLSRLLQS